MTGSDLDGVDTHKALIANSDALLAAIVRSNLDGIVALDESGNVLSWNDGAARLFGYAAAEMLGQSVRKLIPYEHRPEQAAALRRVLSGEELAPLKTTRITAAGDHIAVKITFSPVRNHLQRIVAAAAIVQTPSERMRDDLHEPSLVEARAPTDERDDPRRHVLVVEDEPLIGLGLSAMLENAGFDVIGPVGDVPAAMGLLDSYNCALAILDVNLGRGETSAPVAHRLQRDGIPFFVSSGNVRSTYPPIFHDAPSFPKPLGAGKLVAAVQEVLNRQAA